MIYIVSWESMKPNPVDQKQFTCRAHLKFRVINNHNLIVSTKMTHKSNLCNVGRAEYLRNLEPDISESSYTYVLISQCSSANLA